MLGAELANENRRAGSEQDYQQPEGLFRGLSSLYLSFWENLLHGEPGGASHPDSRYSAGVGKTAWKGSKPTGSRVSRWTWVEQVAQCEGPSEHSLSDYGSSKVLPMVQLHFRRLETEST